MADYYSYDAANRRVHDDGVLLWGGGEDGGGDAAGLLREDAAGDDERDSCVAKFVMTDRLGSTMKHGRDK